MKHCPWQPLAAYLYVLGLEGPSLAWEYLRRNEAYRRQWRDRARARMGAQWGLLMLEDPDLDAQEAHPAWTPSPCETVHVQTAQDDRLAGRLAIWELPGRKYAMQAGAQLRVSLRVDTDRFGVQPSADWIEGAPTQYVLPAGRLAIDAWRVVQRFNALLTEPQSSQRSGRARRVDRIALTHMRALQALDGTLAGASHRDIAITLFGARRVAASWSADGELRAQTRYCIRRGRDFVAGGYRRLVWPPTGENLDRRESP